MLHVSSTDALSNPSELSALVERAVAVKSKLDAEFQKISAAAAAAARTS